MSRLLDSIKQAERARRKRGKTAPAHKPSEADTDVPSNGAELQPASTGETNPGIAPPTHAVTLRIDVDDAPKAASGNSETNRGLIDGVAPVNVHIASGDKATGVATAHAQQHVALDHSQHDRRTDAPESANRKQYRPAEHLPHRGGLRRRAAAACTGWATSNRFWVSSNTGSRTPSPTTGGERAALKEAMRVRPPG